MVYNSCRIVHFTIIIEISTQPKVIDGIIKSGVGRTKWISDSRHLPKMDVYGVGTMLFCSASRPRTTTDLVFTGSARPARMIVEPVV